VDFSFAFWVEQGLKPGFQSCGKELLHRRICLRKPTSGARIENGARRTVIGLILLQKRCKTRANAIIPAARISEF
jgi:hypothetical protein